MSLYVSDIGRNKCSISGEDPDFGMKEVTVTCELDYRVVRFL